MNILQLVYQQLPIEVNWVSLLLIKFIFLYVVRICGIRNNVEHLCNSNLLLYSMYICTSRNLLQCCTSNSNVVQS